jgi:predicted DNA-binding antitoxin AbrB/MazE fold protein
MTIDVDAVYENGILTLKHPVDLPENTQVHVTIQTAAEARTPLGRRLRELRPSPLGRTRDGSCRPARRLAGRVVKLTFVDAGVLIASLKRRTIRR